MSDGTSKSVAQTYSVSVEVPAVREARATVRHAFSVPSKAGHEYLDSPFRRGLEIALVLALLAGLAPVFLLIAIAVRSTSPGPILFRQLRNGRGMRPFEVLKFRTMYWKADEGTVVQARRDDPRVTRVGRILRRTSLDELPQLLNVLAGDMSLIGPRPHAVEHDRIYSELLPDYRMRFGARPGLTGLAQVSGARGCTPHLDDMRRRVDLDLKYLRSATLKMDCSVLLTTLKEVFRSETAW